ncbi:MAG: phage major capsid protein [Gammaproteobacteria bacterium]|nr:phage major capsid protein [Gammaproteobacteria bacterium]
MADSIEVQVKQLNDSIKVVGDSIKAAAEETNRQIKNYGEMNAETRDQVDKLLTAQGELQARLQAAEQRLVKADQRDEPEVQESAGQLVVNALKEGNVNSSFRGSQRVQVPRAAITSTSGGALVEAQRIPGVVTPPTRRMTIRELVAPGTTESNSIEYVRESGFTNAATTVSENPANGKPYSDITFELETAAVRTIAHLFKASRQILDDAPALQSYIDVRARYGLLLAEEAQLLYGNGTGNNVHGIIPQASAYSMPSGVAVTAGQMIDRIRLALLQATLAEFPSTGIVLHPTDWATIELTKDSENRYIIAKPQEGTVPRLWNLPVAETQAINQDEFLVGAFSMAAQIFDRMGIEILISTENDKDFEKNMVTIRAEERLAFSVYRPEAFVTGSLSASW